MNLNIILIFSIIFIISLNACGPSALLDPNACRKCKQFETNLIIKNSTSIFVENITLSYGQNNDGCNFAVLQCSNPTAREITIQWYGPSGTNIGATGAVQNTQQAIGLITCNENSQWISTEIGIIRIVETATCEYTR
ncbi:hypothetical protein QQG55_45415 [Brugia pahangi]